MQLTLTRPDDWHLHVRAADALRAVVPYTARCFRRAIIMPNLEIPVATVKQARAYRDEVLAAVPRGIDFEPLMTLYLTEKTTPEQIEKALRSGIVKAVKLYPAGATTNSASGVVRIEQTFPTLECMAAHGLPLLVHGEVTDANVDVFDRESAFIDRVLARLVERFPQLPIVLEHVTTEDGVEFVKSGSGRVAATITPHHLLYNRNAIFEGGLRPHFYCLPVLKRERHRNALVDAATGGDPRFFLGTDSAPHPRSRKESGCGCAGIFSAHAAMPLYAEVFEEAGALDRLEAFASFNGPAFYGLPRNDDTITLVREPWSVPESYPLGTEHVVPLRAGAEVRWQLTCEAADKR